MPRSLPEKRHQIPVRMTRAQADLAHKIHIDTMPQHRLVSFNAWVIYKLLEEK